MAKGKGNDLMPVIGGVFCFFVAFLQCMGFFSSFQISALLMPSLWLLFGLCLMTKRKNWLCVVGMLPLTILTAQGMFSALPTDSIDVFFRALLCNTLSALGFAVLFVLLFLACVSRGGSLRRKAWWLPLLLVLPGCIWQYAGALYWAQAGMIASVGYWIKPAGK